MEKLGRYEILSELGRGATGVVYRARDTMLDRVVALKTLHIDLPRDERAEYEGRFFQEAKTAGQLNHPNIVTVFDFGEAGNVAYMAMELLEGLELRDLIGGGRKLPPAQALDVAAQIAEALAFAHRQGVVHRDVKPANVMLLPDGRVKLTDFGIARAPSAAVRTMTGVVMGSPKYMSPEQVRGQVVDARSDIFSLGVVLYEMLSGAAPFQGDDVHSIMYQTLNFQPPPLRQLFSGLPPMLDYILAKALAKKADERYQSAEVFAADLRECRDALGAQPGDAAPAVEGVSASALSRHGEDVGPTLAISSAFDSFEATQRLVAMVDAPGVHDPYAATLRLDQRKSAARAVAAGTGMRMHVVLAWLAVALFAVLIGGGLAYWFMR